MVKRFSSILWVAGLGFACNVYNPSLFDSGNDGISGGAGGTTAGGNGSGGTFPTGGTGGTTPTGGTTGSGGAGTGGTSSGGTSSGGTTGTGGGTGEVEIIEDFQNAPANQITVSMGRSGYWFISNDETADAVMTPAAPTDTADFTVLLEPARDTSTQGGHIFGGGFAVWGANAGFNFLDGNNMPYDASGFTGVTFWAKAGDSAPSTSVRLEIADVSTFPAGGVCDGAMDTPATSDDCNAHFGKQFNLSTTWEPHVLAFEGDPGFGQPAFGFQAESFTPGEVYQLTFKFSQGADFDLWVDDIAFTLD